jgi:NAD(P)H-dependent flavin oxidoreductase YrpB (nitropropane dioxygenase family)
MLGSVEAAVRAQQAGVEVIIAQGIEAGGHLAGEVSTMVLLPRVVDAVSAAGRISSIRPTDCPASTRTTKPRRETCEY